jgi:HK97 family phage portal protein
MKFLERWMKPKTETRTSSWDLLHAFTGAGSVPVSPVLAENLSTVLSCVGIISGTVSQLPAYVYRAKGKGRDIVDHPLQSLIDFGPNEHQSWADFVEQMLAGALLRGNALAHVQRDQAGRVERLVPYSWDRVSWTLLPSGRLRFDCTDQNGAVVKLLQDDVFLLRDRTDDGLLGRSRLSRAGSVIRTGLALQEFSESLYHSGAAPSGAITLDQKLSPEAVESLRARFEAAHAGAAKAGKVLVLDQGLGFKQMSMSPEDVELLASKRFQAEELARIYNVPAIMAGINEHSTFTNSEQSGRFFCQYCLGPWIKKYELEARRSIFNVTERDLHLELDMSALMRGDHSQRWAGHATAIQHGILTKNEIREIEGFGPTEGGDHADSATRES